jgi:DNA repair protein RecO (recombination protein O)
MNWADEGIVLAVRAHGETASIVELFTREHGRHLGLVHGGRGRRMRPILQMGNHVDAAWAGRLAEHLGHFRIEPRTAYAARAMDEPLALAALSSICSMARLLPERDPHPNLYEVTLFVLGYLAEANVWPALYVRWELALLAELGLGLDLTSCAATGAKTDLVWVSPRSGRAVSANAGEPYRDQLLALPAFLRPGQSAPVAAGDLAQGLTLTRHFLMSRVFGPRDVDLPEARVQLSQRLVRAAA